MYDLKVKKLWRLENKNACRSVEKILFLQQM